MKQHKKNEPVSKSGSDTTIINIKGNQNAVANHGGKASVTYMETGRKDDFQAWRRKMEHKIDALKSLQEADKSLLKQNIEQVAGEAEKGSRADASRIERLLNSVAMMAPDILEVAISTLANPLAGIGLVAKKIGEKAKVMQKA